MTDPSRHRHPSPYEVGQAMCDVLGLDSNSVMELDITLRPGQFPEVRAVLIGGQELMEFIEIVKHFQLVPRETEEGDDE